jgi:hypothetical protein
MLSDIKKDATTRMQKSVDCVPAGADQAPHRPRHRPRWSTT